jgi:UDP-N-acetylmuramoylalanine--D-glutamate ligase
MIPVRIFESNTVAVLGLARSGMAAVRALIAGGASVVAWDDDAARRDEAKGAGATVGDLSKVDWSEIQALILSPGIPLTHPSPHPIVTKAKNSDVEVIGDVELFVRELASLELNTKLVAITGTNGKSTTTALLGHVLRRQRIETQVGGNIGEAVLDLDPPAHGQVFVLELSSYQLDLTPSLEPDISILLNVTPDHLDRHGGFDGYANAKRKIFANQGKSNVAIVGVDEAASAEICTEISNNGIGEVVPVSVGKTLGRGVYVIDGVLYDGLSAQSVEVESLRECRALLGEHNWQNAAAVYAAGRKLSIESQSIFAAFQSFPGLAHRMEPVGEIAGVPFVNDSKATNAEAAKRALASFEDVIWIAGGQPKEGGLEALEPYFSRVRKAYLIGDAAREFGGILKGKAPFEISKTLDAAVASAIKEVCGKDVGETVVLLSPACASFDQFVDYEERGDVFRNLVQSSINTRRGGAAA